ncbi:MAG: ABC transporter permease subunit [Phycisphaerales bacterium]|nr:ABC transporter permease subunit [Phycisphaerales bacterium]
MPAPTTPIPTTPTHRGRRTGRYGRGDAMVWLMGGALIVNLAMIASLVVLIAVQGLDAFWPRPIDLVTLRSGEQFLGVPVREEAYEAPIERRRELEAQILAGEIDPGALSKDGRPVRRLYRTGNRDLGRDPFRWVTLAELETTERPAEATLLEREEWGVFLGIPEALVLQSVEPAPVDADGAPILGGPETETIEESGVPVRLTRELRTVEDDDGQTRTLLVLRRYQVEGAGPTWGAITDLLPDATERRERIRHLHRTRIGPVNAAMTHLREREAQARIDLSRAGRTGPAGMPRALWAATLLGAALLLGLSLVLGRTSRGAHIPLARRLLPRACLVLAIGLLLLGWLERPRGEPMTPDRLEALQTELGAEQADLNAQYKEFTAQIASVRETDDRFRVLVRAPGLDRFAPERQTAPDDLLRLSQVVRAIQPNTLSTAQKLGVYLDRWWEFLADDPREANTEGGVFPVVFGTVLLTILLSIVVVPLGVLAALYLREYAKQGLVTSIIRIAVNNLAGVPSIVYGVFGLGFFCYTVGAYVDAGPGAATQLPAFRWWFLVGAGLLIVLLASVLGILGIRKPGEPDTRRDRNLRALATCAWVGAFAVLVAMLITTPYFNGFFEAKLPDPTFGKRGLLWASLTLALLTLPVVIVSTEEAIAAVQPSLREGSYGCGASKWQTIKRIVLPGATPGILTGMILAMARGAGEVAPLMLVGALKWAPELPVSADAPFLHLDRSFMHLGFHIYDLGFQSPDSEAARPLVWASTMLLIAVILLLNLTAITLRARVRKKMGSGHF